MESSGPARDTQRAMSQENVDKVMRGFSLYNEGNRDVLYDLVDLDVVWRDLGHAPDLPEVTRGIAALRALTEQWDQAFDDFRAEVQECIDVEDSVLCVTCWRGEGKGSGLTMELNRAEVWEFENGKIIRVTVYPDKAAALEAVGLSE